MRRSDTQSISIAVPPRRVLEVIGDPRRLPEWAPDFAPMIRADDGDIWIVGSGEEEARIVVRIGAELGTVDFLAADLPEGVEIGAFSRVVPNGRGCEFTFTQFFEDKLSEGDISRRVAVVAGELRTVRELCEV